MKNNIIKISALIVMAGSMIACNKSKLETPETVEGLSFENIKVTAVEAEGRQTIYPITKAGESSEIQLLLSLDNPNGTIAEGQTLSATGVAIDTLGHVMVSYHNNNSSNYMVGAVETWWFNTHVNKDNSQDYGLNLGSYFTTVTDVDSYRFNNIIVDDFTSKKATLYFVGSSKKKGGVIASIPYIASNNARFDSSELRVGYVPKGDRKYATDFNSVVKYNSNLITGSTAGFEAFNTNLENIAFDEANGKVKSIATDGTNVVALIVDNDAFGQLVAWTGSNTPTNMLTIAKFKNINPTDGKHVVSIVDGVVYATLADQGVVAYSLDGIKKWNFSLSGKTFANGLDVANGLVYVAYGSAGIYILDAQTGEVVANYSKPGMASANAIKVSTHEYLNQNAHYYDYRDMIYVAQGRDGLVIYKYNTQE